MPRTMTRPKISHVSVMAHRARAIASGIAAAAAGMILLAATARADSIEDGFRNPPDSARPQTWCIG